MGHSISITLQLTPLGILFSEFSPFLWIDMGGILPSSSPSQRHWGLASPQLPQPCVDLVSVPWGLECVRWNKLLAVSVRLSSCSTWGSSRGRRSSKACTFRSWSVCHSAGVLPNPAIAKSYAMTSTPLSPSMCSRILPCQTSGSLLMPNGILTHPWEPCQANHRNPDLYSHNNNNSVTKYTSIHGGSQHELAENQNEI